MGIDVDPDWWKSLFDEVYLLTDARSVCDEEVTRREVDVICELLPVRPDDKILDLCGGHGRHSLELCARGFTSCTLLDYSQCLIDKARDNASGYGYPINFIRADARDIGFPDESFHHVFIMGNSLGYIQEPGADHRILAEAYRLLYPGGWFLVDVTDGKAVKRSFSANAWHEIDNDFVICRQRELKEDSIHAREMVLSKQRGIIRDQTYSVRLYGAKTIAALLEDVGFGTVHVRTGFSPHRCHGDYGFMNNRILATGRKL